MLKFKKIIALLLLLGTTINVGASTPNFEIVEKTEEKPTINIETRSAGAIAPAVGVGAGIITAPVSVPVVVGVVAVGAIVAGGVYLASEHSKNARESTRNKHEEGQSRKQRDQGGEKKEKNGSYVSNRKKRGR